jgi:homopolymeric O-antigen transport system permease protein
VDKDPIGSARHLVHRDRSESAVRPLKIIRPPTFSLGLVFSGVKTLTRYTGLLYSLTSLRLNVRYKQSVLGWFWAVLQPLALMIVYTAIFSRVAKLPSEGTPYQVFVFAGVLPWVFFATSVTNATAGLADHSYLVNKVFFPREIIPLSYVAAAFVDFGISSVVLCVLMIYYKVALTWNILYVVPIIGILIVLTTAVALLLSAIQARVRDVGLAMPLALQVLMLSTPVVYPLKSVPAAVQRFYLLNPMAALIENFRRVVLHGDAPDAVSLAIAGTIAVLGLALAYAGFKNLEATMADFI